MSLRPRLRAPLIAAVSAALVSGLLALGAPTQAEPDTSPAPTPSSKAELLAEQAAAADGLTRSTATFRKSSYLCYGYRDCYEAGYGNGGYSAVNDKMYWRMYAGHNCTNYAAYRMVKSGLPNTRPWSGGGNATYWGTSMASITDRTPAVGAVAWWKANVGPAGSAGHVAYVEKVVSADEIIVSQDSWGGDFAWAVITRASGNWPSGFVHFNDVKLVNRAVPTVSGLAKVGGTLTATAGTWKPSDATVSYQWYSGTRAISGATKSTVTLGKGWLGQTVTVRTTASKAGYPTKTVASAPTAAVLPGVLSATTAPAITGTPKVESTLSVSSGVWNPAPSSQTYQWYADGVAIAGATGTTLTLGPDLAGKTISASVTASRSGYTAVTARTTSTAAVAPGTIRVRRGPAVTGTPQPGQTLTVETGVYRPGDVTPSVQWLRNGQPIEGATGSTYVLTAADLGARVSASVTAARDGYTSRTLATDPTGVVRDVPRIKIEKIRLKHGVKLVIRVDARYVPEVTGDLRVAVQGGFRQVVTLRHGTARVIVKDVPPGRLALRVTYRGSTTVQPGTRLAALWMRASR